MPTCDMTRYRYAARRLARTSWSVATSAAVASVITSQANRNVITSPAANTSSTRSEQRIEADAHDGRARGGDRVGEVARAVERHRDGDDSQHHQKPRRQRRRRHSRTPCRMRRDAAARHRPGDPRPARRRRETASSPTPESSRPTPRGGTRPGGDASASVTATVIRRIPSATGTPAAITSPTLNSASPPDEKHQTHDQGDHVREVRMETARLQHFHRRRPSAGRRPVTGRRRSARTSARSPSGSAPRAESTATHPSAPRPRASADRRRRRSSSAAWRTPSPCTPYAQSRSPPHPHVGTRRATRPPRAVRTTATPSAPSIATPSAIGAHAIEGLERRTSSAARRAPDLSPAAVQATTVSDGVQRLEHQAGEQTQAQAQRGQRRLRHQHHRRRLLRVGGGRGSAARPGT